MKQILLRHHPSLASNLQNIEDNIKIYIYVQAGCLLFNEMLRDQPFNLQGEGGGYGFLFRSELFFSDNTRVRIFFSDTMNSVVCYT
jgi:hypothetical protein